MKDTNITEAVREVVAVRMKAVDEFIKEVVDPLENVGNPEKFLGKPWNTWTPQDMQILQGVYGSQLEDFIAKKAITEMREHESEVM